ncbi:GTPase ObgE [Mycoplasma sp. ATU-Cv-703]|uniref:GTPase ObgE n=1 Tax=Mycoplasma sp. ATU-Cv-703 TaxID=2498595 RepID=UPI000FDD4CF4
MKFVDECQIEVRAGKGGDGIISFRREKKVPRGGPDGGDGGRGGNVFLKGDSGLNTLIHLHQLKIIQAEDGANGQSKNKTGAGGQDLYVKVPLGTLVYERGKLVHDIVKSENYLVAQGGTGGHGNARFKSARNPAPRLCENGRPGQKRRLDLSLKVLADVGLVGLPSVGKSSLLGRLSQAKAKVADYPFTTLVPQLGLVKVGDFSFVLADLPGLIAGASEGKGLGHAFLKHVQRTRVVLHVLDLGKDEGDWWKDYQTIRHELVSFDKRLANLPELVAANKSDCPGFEKRYQSLVQKLGPERVLALSAKTGAGLQTLKQRLANLLEKVGPVQGSAEETDLVIELTDQTAPTQVRRIGPGSFSVTGSEVEKICQRIPLNSLDNIRRFNRKMRQLGVWDRLAKLGAKAGDNVKIFDHQLTWETDPDL